MIRLMNLQQDPRTGIYSYRKVVPAKLRAAFGKAEFKVSLGTRNLAEARQRMAEPAARYAQLAEEAALSAEGGLPALGRRIFNSWLAKMERPDFWLELSLTRLPAFLRAARSMERDILPRLKTRGRLAAQNAGQSGTGQICVGRAQGPQCRDTIADIGRRGERGVSRKRVAGRQIDDGAIWTQHAQDRRDGLTLLLVVGNEHDRLTRHKVCNAETDRCKGDHRKILL